MASVEGRQRANGLSRGWRGGSPDGETGQALLMGGVQVSKRKSPFRTGSSLTKHCTSQYPKHSEEKRFLDAMLLEMPR